MPHRRRRAGGGGTDVRAISAAAIIAIDRAPRLTRWKREAKRRVVGMLKARHWPVRPKTTRRRMPKSHDCRADQEASIPGRFQPVGRQFWTFVARARLARPRMQASGLGAAGSLQTASHSIKSNLKMRSRCCFMIVSVNPHRAHCARALSIERLMGPP